MLAGVMWLWFVETAISVLYVAVDIRTTPEAPIMKVGFVILTLFLGPVGAFLYVLGCREPLPHTHEAFVAVRWRQVLGSTMHCVAGDGVGILVAAVITARAGLPMREDIVFEYLAGFLFGWTVFQALFMRGMAGGSYTKSLRTTLVPEFMSMNGVMTGMIPVMVGLMAAWPGAGSPATPQFWFAMSLALLAGFIVAYPINWWLVSAGLKHGMMTVRADSAPVPLVSGLYTAGHALHAAAAAPHAHGHGEHKDSHPSPPQRPGLALAAGATLVPLFGALTLLGAFGYL